MTKDWDNPGPPPHPTSDPVGFDDLSDTSVKPSPASIPWPERSFADLIARYYRHEIGVLMQQAEHWAANDKPLAVHHRLHKADAYYQVVVLFERFAQQNVNPFEFMRAELERGHSKPYGKFPSTPSLHRYRDPHFVAAELDRLHRASKGGA